MATAPPGPIRVAGQPRLPVPVVRPQLAVRVRVPGAVLRVRGPGGDAGHLADGVMQRIVRPENPRRYGMCGLLTGYPAAATISP